MRHALAITSLIALAAPAPALAQDAAPARPVTSQLRVLVTPDDATISLGGAVIGTGSATTSLPAGSHTVRVEREGYTSQIETILLTEDKPSDIILRINLSKTPAPAPGAPREPGLVDGLGDARTLTGGIGVGLGIGLVATSAALAASSGPPPSCSTETPQSCDDAADLSGWAATAGVAGGALLTAGISLLVWDALAGAKAPASVSLSPTDGGAHASFRLRF